MSGARQVDYRDEDTALTGVFVEPETRIAEPAGILLVHGGAGLDAHAEEQAERFAALGYPVFA